MPAAFALGMNSGKIILIEQCRAVCGPPGIAFSQMELGRQGADAAPASYGSGGAAGEELALSASLRSAALPKGDPLAWRQGFQLNCEVSSFARASPFGRGVTAGDGEGSRREKLPQSSRFARCQPPRRWGLDMAGKLPDKLQSFRHARGSLSEGAGKTVRF